MLDIRGIAVTRVTWVNGVKHVSLAGEDSPPLSSGSETLAVSYTGVLSAARSSPACQGDNTAAPPVSAAPEDQRLEAAAGAAEYCYWCGHEPQGNEAQLQRVWTRSRFSAHLCGVCRSISDLTDNLATFEHLSTPNLRANLQTKLDETNLWLIQEAFKRQEQSSSSSTQYGEEGVHPSGGSSHDRTWRPASYQ